VHGTPVCRSLLEKVHHIDLDAKADHDAAAACYSALDFEAVAPYSEFTVEQKRCSCAAESGTQRNDLI